MPSCSAYGCTNRASKKIPGITFHRFPKDERRRKLWILAVKRKNWTPSSCSVLCSNHFPGSMKDRTSTLSRLKENAVPCLFDGIPYSIRKAWEEAKTLPEKKTARSAEALKIAHDSSPDMIGPFSNSLLNSAVEINDDSVSNSPDDNIMDSTLNSGDESNDRAASNDSDDIAESTSNTGDESNDGAVSNGLNDVGNGSSFNVWDEIKGFSTDSNWCPNGRLYSDDDISRDSFGSDSMAEQIFNTARTIAEYSAACTSSNEIIPLKLEIRELREALEKEREKVKILEEKDQQSQRKIEDLSKILQNFN